MIEKKFSIKWAHRGNSQESGYARKWYLSPIQAVSGRLPRWHCGKESSMQCRRCKRRGFNPRIRKMTWGRKEQPTLAFLPGKFRGQRSKVGNAPWRLQRVRHERMRVRAHTHTHTHNRLTANIMFSGDKLKAFLLRKDLEQNKIVVTHSHHIFIYLFSFGM